MLGSSLITLLLETDKFATECANFISGLSVSCLFCFSSPAPTRKLYYPESLKNHAFKIIAEFYRIGEN